MGRRKHMATMKYERMDPVITLVRKELKLATDPRLRLPYAPTDEVREKCYKFNDSEYCENEPWPGRFLFSVQRCVGLGETRKCSITIDGYRDKPTKFAYIDLMYVDREGRGKGYGGETYIKLEKLLRSLGVKKIQLVALNDAIKYWRKMGFSPSSPKTASLGTQRHEKILR